MRKWSCDQTLHCPMFNTKIKNWRLFFFFFFFWIAVTKCITLSSYLWMYVWGIFFVFLGGCGGCPCNEKFSLRTFYGLYRYDLEKTNKKRRKIYLLCFFFCFLFFCQFWNKNYICESIDRVRAHTHTRTHTHVQTFMHTDINTHIGFKGFSEFFEERKNWNS